MKQYEIIGLACFGILLTAVAANGQRLTTTNAPASIPWSQLGVKAGADYKGDGLAVTPTAFGACLHCVFQRLDGEATSEGLWLTSTLTNKASERFRVTAMEIGREPANEAFNSWSPKWNIQLSLVGNVSVEGQTVSFVRPGLREEYSVSMDGVRQDFVVTDKPPGVGQLKLRLSVSGALVQPAAYGSQLALLKSGRKIAYNRLRATDASGKQLSARLQADRTHETLDVVVDDTRATYPVRIDPTFSDANWISMNPSIPGTDGKVAAAALDGSGNLYIGGSFTVVGNVIARNIAKWNGSSWSSLDSGLNGGVGALAMSGGTLYAGGSFGIEQWNGTNWSPLGAGVAGGNPVDGAYYTSVDALAMSGGTLYVGGSFTMAGGKAANYIAQWDGTNWSSLGSGMGGGWNGTYVYALAVSGDTLYACGNFTTAGGKAANYIAQWNGTNWSPLGLGIGGDDPYVEALAVSGATLYVGGYFTNAGGNAANSIAQWNGSSWSPLASGVGGGAPFVFALAVSGGALYVGGYFTTAGGNAANSIAQWNGSSWVPLGAGVSGKSLYVDLTEVFALVVSGGTMYVGGEFGMAGEVGANNIAQWNGNSWLAFGSGISGQGLDENGPYVSALAVSGAMLYAGGAFTVAGGKAPNNIAQWNGSVWSPLGSGIAGTGPSGLGPYASALAVSGNILYAGGEFTMAGGKPANYIAQWNGTNWSPLGSGVNGPVYSLAVSDGVLYVGGSFTTAGAAAANSIARWNGSSWSPLGTGLGGGNPGIGYYPDAYAMAVSDGTLYVGGYFTSAGGVAANNIAQWNGTSWSALGSGTDNNVVTLAVSGGVVYAGGYFTTAGGSAANYIAQWNGGSWSPLGAGMNGEVYALAVSGAMLYAGGQFGTAGGDGANCIAQWNGSSWLPLGSGVRGASTSVSALAVSGNTLYAGGSFTTAGANVSAYAAEAILGPTVLFTVTPMTGLAPLTVDFTSSTNDSADNAIVSWNWTFGDGGTGTNQNPSHIYDAVGTYYPTLLATNSLGGTVYGSGPSSILVTNIPVDYTITLIAVPSQGGSVNGAGTYVSGTSQTVIAIASNGYSFSDWTENGAVVSSSTSYTFTLTNGVSLMANFNSTNKSVILFTNGYGGITHAAWPKSMVPGKKYTVMAVSKAKNLFVNWTGGTSQPYSALSTSPGYTLTFELNLVLEANFETNLFLAAQGAYTGLFAPTGQPRQQTNSGAFTLNVTSAGSLSGDLYLGSATPIVLNGKFGPDGTATVVNERKGENTLTTVLSLDITNETISGAVSDGSFVAQLSGFQSVFSAKNKAPFAGTYTLVIPGVTNPAEGPYGDSYGTVTVSAAGAISFAGSLADGTSVSRASTISSDGTWPFYLPLYNGKGSLYSWNSFTNVGTNGMISFATNGSWINATNSSKTAVYRSGFTNQTAALLGFRYNASARPLFGAASGQIVLLQSSFAITNDASISTAGAVKAEGTNKVSFKMPTANGVISGSFANPLNPKQTVPINGVLLQGDAVAVGYFLGTNQSGVFLLQASDP